MQQFTTTILTAIVTVFFCCQILSVVAKAYDDATTCEDLSFCASEEIVDTMMLYNHLKSLGYVDGDVTFSDFDYYVVLTQQLCQQKTVRPELILAQIAVESRFNQNASGSSGSKGLMQLIPVYHTERMEPYVEGEVSLDDFYNPRLNIITGIDYMEELLTSIDDNIPYALMCYNQGVKSASKTYEKGITSTYAQTIIDLSGDIKGYFIRRYEPCSECKLTNQT